MEEILKAALSYLVKRKWSVIPLRRDKKPYLDSWKPYQQALPTEAEVRAWWNKWPEANVGIVTGKISGFVVVDADGPDGMESLKKLGAIPPTPTVRTGKGWHYYFAYPGKEIKNFARRLPGLDFRGDGGYVMAPPSVHPSGHVYEWAISPDMETPAPLPESILKLLEVGAGGAPVGEKSPDWVEAFLAGVTEGQRNTAAARLAGHYLGKGLPPSEVEQLLLFWNRNNRPPLPDQEIATVVASVARAEAEKHKGDRNFEIAKIEKLATEPPIYRVHIFDRVVKMNSEDLASFSRFKRIVMQETNRVPAMKKAAQNWDPYLDEVLATRLEIVEAPEEASQEAVLWEAVLQYLRTRSTTDEAALAELRGVYQDEKYFYLHGPSLFRYMQQRQYRVEPRELWDLLRKYGAKNGPKRVKDTEGNSVVMKPWWVPVTVLPSKENHEEGFSQVAADIDPF